jgi:N-acetylglucosamine kinase-like BadF-type ATPase
MQYILGVDGGGSKTTAVLADSTGKVIGSGRGGASNYQTIGLENASNSIDTAIRTAIDSATTNFGINPTDLERTLIVVLGLAGADRSWDKACLNSTLTAKLPLHPERLLIENDAQIALAGATGNSPGIILIAGTGSIALGIDHRGQQIRVGGWGPILGDEGSGYSIGKAALTAILREYDGRGKPTSLTKRLLKHLEITNPEELIPLVYQNQLPRPKIAKLAEIVLEEAALADTVSQSLVTEAAKQLVEMIGVLLTELDWNNAPIIAGTGGLLRCGNPLWKAVTQILTHFYPQNRLIPPLLPPELGAILLGKEYLKSTFPDKEFIEHLVSYSHSK